MHGIELLKINPLNSLTYSLFFATIHEVPIHYYFNLKLAFVNKDNLHILVEYELIEL